MRIYGDPVRAKANLARGRAAARLRRHEYLGDLPRRPDKGTLLRTLTVMDHVTGSSYDLEIRQASRKNGIEVFRFGNQLDVGGSYDGLFRFLRKHWKLNWLEIL